MCFFNQHSHYITTINSLLYQIIHTNSTWRKNILIETNFFGDVMCRSFIKHESCRMKRPQAVKPMASPEWKLNASLSLFGLIFSSSPLATVFCNATTVYWALSLSTIPCTLDPLAANKMSFSCLGVLSLWTLTVKCYLFIWQMLLSKVTCSAFSVFFQYVCSLGIDLWPWSCLHHTLWTTSWMPLYDILTNCRSIAFKAHVRTFGSHSMLLFLSRQPIGSVVVESSSFKAWVGCIRIKTKTRRDLWVFITHLFKHALNN